MHTVDEHGDWGQTYHRVILDTQEERQEMENIRQEIRQHLHAASNCAFFQMRTIVAQKQKSLIESNERIRQKNLAIDRMPWYKRWTQIRGQGEFKVTFIMMWQWKYVNPPKTDLLRGDMLMEEYEALREYCMTKQIDKFVWTASVERDPDIEGGGYHDFGGVIARMTNEPSEAPVFEIDRQMVTPGESFAPFELGDGEVAYAEGLYPKPLVGYVYEVRDQMVPR